MTLHSFLDSDTDRFMATLPLPESKPQGTFIPSRYPSTYARDYVRQHSNADMNRYDAGQAIRAWAKQEEIDPTSLFFALADRYVAKHNIARPDNVSELAELFTA